MNPRRVSFGLQLVLIALAMLLPVAARSAPDAPVTPEPAPLPVHGKTLRIPPPRGMVTVTVMTSVSGKLLSVPPDIGKSPDAIAYFAPESLLASKFQGPGPPVPGLDVAIASPWPMGEGTAGEAAGFIKYQRAAGRHGLSASGRDSVALQAAWRPLEEDAEGDADQRIEVPGQGPLGLELIDLGAAGFGSIQANPVPAAASGASSPGWYVRAVATLVVADRALFAVMNTSRPVSTGTVADLRRRFGDWVGEIQLENAPGESGEWARRAARAAEPDRTAPPKFGEFVRVEKIPEVLLRVAPDYPEAARRGGLSGEVLVQALVATDGRVVDARITKSVPGLDGSALRAVRMWRFIPARNGNAPVAVWVAVPVKFSLH